MKLKSMMAVSAILAGLVLASGTAVAGADDMAWIAKCLKDNAAAQVGPEVITAYCTCMNGKMSENETLSISAWEKTHPQEMAACERQSGWK